MTVELAYGDAQPVTLAVESEGETLFVPAATALQLTGWELKPEGMCRAELCMPLPAKLVRKDAVDLAGFSRLLDRPVVHEGDVWHIGAAAAERSEARRSAEAPAFELPDLSGRRHRLSDYRGIKVLLLSWASW